MNKILLACPVADYKEYVIYKWLKHIQKLTIKCDILLVDNSSKPFFAEKLRQTGIKVMHFQPMKNDLNKRHIMAYCLEKIREYVLKNGYDYFFSLECDIFPPFNIIERLLLINNDVSGAIYFIDLGHYSKIMIQRIEPKNTGFTSLIRNLTTNESFIFCDGRVKQVFACGLGCVLIRRNILQKIKFRVLGEDKVHADSIFYRDLYNLQIPVKVDTGIICDHYNQDWGIIINKQNEYENTIKR